jgi:cobyrinic acid a,c-diamide synthase
MRPETLTALAEAAACDAELLLVEGVMGLFDGARDGSASTADLAARFGWPVILVVDVHGQAGSAAATIRGFQHFRSDIALAGVICNRVAGAAHVEMLLRALEPLELPLLGFLPAQASLSLPSRHLGLVQAREQRALESLLDDAAAWAADHIDLDRLRGLARPTRTPTNSPVSTIPPLGQHIAVAADNAFAFAYPHVLDGWRRAGAELAFFSPLADQAPDQGADAIYLPGGYPELHAGKLAGNPRFLASLRDAADRGTAIFGECGGYMVLGDGLVDATGVRHAMAGLLPLETSFAERKLHLGYRTAALAAATPLGRSGARFRGHEFHYARVVAEPRDAPLFACCDALGADLGTKGARRQNVFGSFVHLIDAA